MNATTAIGAYQKVGVESAVTAADPHKLISMLYQGALLAISNAKNGILRKDIPAKGAAISKAIMIIDDGLNASLDKDVGGDLAKNLASLYEYMGNRLLNANLNNDIAALDEVARLLTELKEAWDAIRQTSMTSAPAAPQQPVQIAQATPAPVTPAVSKVQALYGRT
ncbi:MAG: flagellar export chaperone FliS [Gallionellales bacterium GWA2_60_142]|jgi:flagellar protein FliS|nr:MAG: flagellar export chaperone FliS [Gallionellales bacterium GWA2_60_142]HCI13463.1 flagellar export chaperone FliS [Gallionellaceae bacterium]